MMCLDCVSDAALRSLPCLFLMIIAFNPLSWTIATFDDADQRSATAVELCDDCDIIA